MLNSVIAAKAGAAGVRHVGGDLDQTPARRSPRTVPSTGATDEYAAYVKSCWKRGILPCSLDSFVATLRPDVRTWRERIGAEPDFPLRTSKDVVRAMAEEIAELRDLAVSRARAPKSMADGRQLIVIGGKSVSTGVLLDLQRDATRYRWLRDKADSMARTAAPMVASLSHDGRMVGLLDGEDLDAAVDLAMTQPSAGSLIQSNR